MGFSVTASHLIIVITMLAAGGAAGVKGLDTYRDVHDQERAAADHRADYLRTTLLFDTADTYPKYQGGAVDLYEVRIENTGTTTLRASELTFLIDGVYANGLIVGSPRIDESTATDLWMHGQVLEVDFQPVTSEPDNFAAFAANGAAVYYVRP